MRRFAGASVCGRSTFGLREQRRLVGNFALLAKPQLMRIFGERAPYRDRLALREDALRRGVARITEICATLADVRAAYVFGSHARGNVRLQSDLDILVVRETEVRRAERDLDIRRAFDIGVGLDLIVVTPYEYAHVLPTTAFGQTILTQCVAIYAA